MTKQHFTIKHRKICLENLIVPFQIGIHDFEQNNKQRVSINIELTLGPSHLPSDDNIATTVDYDYFRAEILKLAQTQSFNLQETLCDAIMDICFQNENVSEAKIRTSKIDVYPDCDAVSYEMSARKQV